jgi:hypothetical protein
MAKVAAVSVDDVSETGRNLLTNIPLFPSFGLGTGFLTSVLKNIFDSTPASLFLLIVFSNLARAERMLALPDMVKVLLLDTVLRKIRRTLKS